MAWLRTDGQKLRCQCRLVGNGMRGIFQSLAPRGVARPELFVNVEVLIGNGKGFQVACSFVLPQHKSKLREDADGILTF